MNERILVILLSELWWLIRIETKITFIKRIIDEIQ